MFSRFLSRIRLQANRLLKLNPIQFPVEQVETSAVERTSDFVTIVPARPWRKPETVLRVWLAPFHDKLGDLHDQRYLYVRLENGGWTTDSVNELVSSSRLSKPVYPLSSDQPQDPNEAKKEKLKQLPAFGFTGKP